MWLEPKSDLNIYKEEKTAYGKQVSFETGVERPLSGFVLYGKSTQVTTTGAQLFDPNAGFNTNNDTTFEVLDNGKELVITTDLKDLGGEGTYRNILFDLNGLIGKTVTISCSECDLISGEKNACDIHFKNKDGKMEYHTCSNNGIKTVIIPEDAMSCCFRLLVIEQNNTSIKPGNYTVRLRNVMLNEGSKALPFEPYTGGKPSPSPEYPQPINSVGGSNNLFQIVKENITTRDGFKSVINSDRSLTVTGTPSRQFAVAYSSRINLPTGTYYISDGHNKADEIIFQMAIEYTDNKKRYYNNMAFNIDSTVKTLNLIIQYQSSDLQPVNCTLYPMINKGEKPLPFETYVDSINVDVNGGNLLKPTQKFPITQHGMTLSQNIDGSYHLSGTAISDGNIRIVDPDIETYGLNIPKCTLSLKIKNGEYDGELVVSKPDKEWKGLLSVRKNHMSTGSLISDEIGCFVTFTSGVTYNVDLYPMLNAGSTPLPFEPYKPKQTLTIDTPNGLPGIPVNKGGNYMDVNGQQWICDEIDLGRGKYIQRVNYLDENQFGLSNIAPNTSGTRFAAVLSDITKTVRTPVLSNFFKYNSVSNGSFKTEGDYISTDELGIINIRLAQEMDIVQFKEKFSGLTVYYVLETPVETPLSPEEIFSYKALHTYSPTTVMENDAESWMRVEYYTAYMETKTDWKSSDFFNVQDYNRIKGNLNEIRKLALTLWPDFSFEDMGEDKSYEDYSFYADEINRFEANVEHICQGTFPFQVGERQTFYDNTPFIGWQELNRLEEACRLMYSNLKSREEGRKMLAFTLNGGLFG